MCVLLPVASLAQSFSFPAVPFPLVTMAMVDSVATFKARVVDLGLGEFWHKFEEKRFTSYAAFAFSSNFQPGNPDEKASIEDTLKPILGEDPALRHVMRRLFYESFALVSADMKNTVEGARRGQTQQDEPRRAGRSA